MLSKSTKINLPETEVVTKKTKFTKKAVQRILLIILGVIIGVGFTFLYIQKFGIPFRNMSQNISKIEQEKILNEMVEKVGKLIILPQDEVPVMATIEDAETLMKKEVFYAGTKNGDIVLMYQKALKAVVYSPDRNIIVNVGPIYVEPNKETAIQNNQNVSDDTKSTTTPTVQKKK